MNNEARFSATVWGILALGAVAFGLLLAFIAGYFLGHFTGHTKTTTVAASEVSANETTAPPKEAAPEPETTAEAETGTGETKEAEKESGRGEGASGTAKAEEGKQVFAANGCGSCHTFKAANSTGTVGPDLNEYLAPDDDKAGIEEMIVDPNAEIAEGFSANVMPKNYRQTLSKKELEQLVQFLIKNSPAGGGKPEGPGGEEKDVGGPSQ